MEEIEDFKREKNQVRLARLDQDRALQDLMSELDLKREREIRAKVEKQEILKTLQDLERTKITALERDKKRELERLAAEREGLRLREEEVMQEIHELEVRIQEKERMVREQMQLESHRVANMENQGANGRRREIQLAKERGENIAGLQHKRDMLEKDRLRIMEDLERIKNGEISSLRKNEASRWAASDILAMQPSGIAVDINRIKLDPMIKDKLLSDEVRIRRLKDQRENTLKEMVPESEELDPLTRNFETQQNTIEFYRPLNDSQPAGPRTIPSPLKKSVNFERLQNPMQNEHSLMREEPADMVQKLN